LDITNLQLVKSFVAEHKIDVLINCAAYTNVDKAETDYETADLINNKAVENLALACADNNILMIHVSTDYVFGGDEERNTPYKEDDLVNPLGVYGKTKLAGEESIKRILNDYIILRTAWLYSIFGNNFVKTMLRLTSERETISVVADQVGTPTYAKDLADVIYKIIKNEQELRGEKIRGIYNFTDEGICSWYDFAKEIAFLSKSKCVVSPCTSLEYGSKVKRPKYSVLSKEK
jgi:dTDP-4-dehydrorhamnose reductase